MKNLLSTVFLSKRAKSFYWRAGVGLGSLYAAYLLNILPSLELPEFVGIGAVYLLNEITKALNNLKQKNG